MLGTCYVFSARICHKAADRMLILPACGLGGAVLFNSLLGQTGTYLAACVFVYAFAYRRRDVLAGIALGLMTFKPQYALPLGLVALLDRQWRTVGASFVTLIVTLVVSGMLWGFHHWSEFIQAAGAYNHTVSHMCNWMAVAARWTPMAPESIASVGISIMLVGCLAVAFFHRQYPERRFAMMRLAFAITLALVASPNTHPYDLVIWLVPLAVLARRWLHVPIWSAVLAGGMITAWTILGDMRWALPFASTSLAIGLLLVANRCSDRSGHYDAAAAVAH